MEAFAALMIKNNMQKWEAMFKYNFPSGKARKFKFRATESADAKKTEIPNFVYIYLDKNPEFKPKWTQANSGQAKL